jgi:hypothetical protein
VINTAKNPLLVTGYELRVTGSEHETRNPEQIVYEFRFTYNMRCITVTWVRTASTTIT